MKREQVIFIGAGLQSLSISELIEDMNEQRMANYEVLGYLDDREELIGTEILSLPVLDKIANATKYRDAKFVNGIWSINNYCNLDKILGRTGVEPDRWINIIHPTAWVSKHTEIGYGVIVYPFAKIYNSSQIGNFVLMLPRSTVGMKNNIGSQVVIGTNCVLAGRIHVGDNVYFGQNSCVREDLKIGKGTKVGMGSVVTCDVDENQVVFGNPARPKND